MSTSADKNIIGHLFLRCVTQQPSIAKSLVIQVFTETLTLECCMCSWIMCCDGTDFCLLLLMMLIGQTTQHWMVAQLTNNWKWCGGKQLWPNFRYSPGTHLDKTKKTMQNSKHLISQLRFDQGTSKIQVRSINASVPSSLMAAPTNNSNRSSINYWCLVGVCRLYALWHKWGWKGNRKSSKENSTWYQMPH